MTFNATEIAMRYAAVTHPVKKSSDKLLAIAKLK
jgi:hypothetical protein